MQLLDIPEEILQNIARHLTLREWVKGPAPACRLLHDMELRLVDLRCKRYVYVSPNPSFPCLLVCGGHTLQPNFSGLLIFVSAFWLVEYSGSNLGKAPLSVLNAIEPE